VRRALHVLQRVQQGCRRRHLVCFGRDTSPRLLRRDLDELDICLEDQGGQTTNDLFGFLTTEPNDVVGLIHPKAMPVILTAP
jgi:hypothetical protein